MNASGSRTLTIGEFGRRSGLSIKALRLYDGSGLLRPARVDPVSGYRQYSDDQLERARRIGLLRRLGMPLAVIAEVLAGADQDAVVRLDRWWAAQEESIQARRGTLGWLRAQLARSATEPPPHPVHRRRVPDTKIACLRTEADQHGLLDAIREGEWEIRRHLDAASGNTTAEFWVLFEGQVTPDSEAPIELCVPFTGTVEPAGRIAIRMEAAHCEVYTTVRRDDCYYPRIMHAYDAVDAYRVAAGLLRSGPPREIYLGLWNELEGTDPFVHIASPFIEEN
jgi:DNA-binding transcriptional MerR regulator